MSRNVKEQQKKIFDILQNFVPEEMREKISNKEREVYLSEKEYNIIANAEYICNKNISDIALGLIKYDSRTYICVKEFKESFMCDSSKYVSDLEVLHGIGILMFIDRMITISDDVNGYIIFDRFFGFDEEKRYSCEDFFDIIQNYVVFEFDDQDIEIRYMEDLDRLSYMMYFNNDDNSETIELSSNIYHILETNSSKCIVSILGNIAQTKSVSDIFLQLYRCLEYLFIICKALEYSEKYRLQDNVSKIVRVLDAEKIRFSESGCLHQVIDTYAMSEIVDEYYKYIDKNVRTDGIISEKKVQTVCDYIYGTRCKIAHYKYGQEDIVDENTLQISNIILCKLVRNIFEKMDDILMQINMELDVFHEIKFMNKKE